MAEAGTDRRPRLAVVFGVGSSGTFRLRDAVSHFCDLIWVVSRPLAEPDRRIIGRLGPVVDAQEYDLAAVCQRLADLHVDGIVTFNDSDLELTSQLALSLGLPSHSLATARRLTDKYLQRSALRDADVPTPPVIRVSPKTPPDQLAAQLAGMSWPAVVKPVASAASRQTTRAADIGQVVEHLTAAAVDGVEEDFVVEGQLLPPREVPWSPLGDFLSVETLFTDGEPTTIGVMAKFPLAPPFRETGDVLPAPIQRDAWEEAAVLAARAATALGVSWGSTHTELKLTDAGLRVIEVNGRMAGRGMSDLYRSAGVPLVELTARSALGGAHAFDPSRAPVIDPDRAGVGPYQFEYFLQPPVGARRLVAVEGVSDAATIPGVTRTATNKVAGDDLDWRRGFFEYVLAVQGVAPDLATLHSVPGEVHSRVRPVYEFEGP
ncbi:MAG: ATP-grasp domain-containing protein [Acidobacteriota bacterium]|nr:ATP-grasp domain-containing protein [Acidobacteriota bacterium]